MIVKKNPSRNNQAWTIEEDKLLTKLLRNGASHAEAAAVMGRSHRSVSNRSSVLFVPNTRYATLRGSSPTPASISMQEPAMIEIVKEDPDKDLELFLWFMKGAWLEDHSVLIPTLGATFQRLNEVRS